MKLFIWKKSDFYCVMPFYSINTHTSRQVNLLKIVLPCKQTRGYRKENFCRQETTFQDGAKKQQEKGKSRSVKASPGNFTLFVLSGVTQPIDFRRWDNKCIPKGGPSQKSPFLQLTEDTPPSLPTGLNPKCLFNNIYFFWHSSGGKITNFGFYPE